MIITRPGIITRQGIVRARQLQESMLSTPMPPPGLTAAAYFRPAESVGGDLYELVELPDGRLLLAIADVCGHGKSAALLAVVVQWGIRRFAHPAPTASLAAATQPP